MEIILTLPVEDLEDIYWQSFLYELESHLHSSNINALSVKNILPSGEGIKSCTNEVIEGIRIILDVAIIPVVITAIKEFSSIRRAKKIKIKTKNREVVIDALSEKGMIELTRTFCRSKS